MVPGSDVAVVTEAEENSGVPMAREAEENSSGVPTAREAEEAGRREGQRGKWERRKVQTRMRAGRLAIAAEGEGRAEAWQE